MIKKKRLGDILVEAGFITEEQLMEALEVQKDTDKRLGIVLKEMGFITEQDIVEALEFQLGIPQVDLKKFIIDPEIVNLISKSLAQRHKAIPIKRKGNTLTVAMADPLDVLAIDDIRIKSGCEVIPVIASKSEIKYAIDQYFSTDYDVDEILQEMDSGQLSERNFEADIDRLREMVEDAPVVRLVNNIIADGVRLKASDIHIEPQENEVRIRYRIDGILHNEMKIPKQNHAGLVSRIKIISELDIAERRIPQDGRIEMSIDDKDIDLRVSTLPTVKGEKVVMRILDKSNLMLNLNDLGFLPGQFNSFKKMINKPHGIVLITGPTGSGKTTTLYSALSSLDSENENIITVENPVEYQLEGISQVQTNNKAGLTFANSLRAILRQDPDIVMVGEIRDKETAQIAVNAALTGHLVLSTLHTNQASGAISRLIDMGVEPFLVASSVVGVVAQRLLRRICPECKKKAEDPLIDPQIEKYLGQEYESIDFYYGDGCKRCNGSGYRGRVAIHELLEVDSELKRMIVEKASADEIEEAAIKKGMTILEGAALHKVNNGTTTLEEAMRVTKVHIEGNEEGNN